MQVIDQVLGWALFDTAALSGHWWIGRIGTQPLPDQVAIAVLEIADLIRGERRQLVLLGAFDRLFDLQEQLEHVLRPGLRVVLVNKDQLAQVMGVAQGMLGMRVWFVGAIAIVHHPACALRQNANLIQCFAAALL